MKYLIVGLGNPGIKYRKTRHNIGFQVLDFISDDLQATFSTDRYADVAKASFKAKKIVLLKPNTFMNLSGKAVSYWQKKTKVNLSNILIVTDDISLPFGTLRLKAKGSDGGHNGLKNINEHLDSKSYSRLKFGIGSNFFKGQQADYVLSSFETVEMDNMLDLKKNAVEIIKSYISLGSERTMSIYNGR
tara:strand:- start:1332 stop:1895 length:564 start_codon:yes stop_codon:yes gene_type:complete